MILKKKVHEIYAKFTENSKNRLFLKIQNSISWPEVTDGRSIVERESRSVPNSCQNFLYRSKSKIDDFSEPLPPFFGKKGGGGYFYFL
jgi:hypothetical protein